MRRLSLLFCFLFFFLFAFLYAQNSHAQNLLHQRISVHYVRQPLQKVLSQISHQGSFYFSYNSHIIPGDSLITIEADQKTLKEILQLLLGQQYQFKEHAKYIIIKKVTGTFFTIKGRIIDKFTGKKIPDVSVYASRRFVSTLTNSDGHFQLRLKSNQFPDVLLGVSKINYKDTIYQLPSGFNQSVTLAISPATPIQLPEVTVNAASGLEKIWLSKLFISSKQKIRDINLSQFFMKQPFQYSVWPGLGTHGKLSAQVVNKFSFNILGGYSAGANGFEFGGLFNMDKNDVKYVQIAGLFNIVGGGMTGFQLSGLYNHVDKSVNGVQIAGLTNQSQKIKGLQLAGIGNMNQGESNGVQAAGLFNYSHYNKGIQIGLINISDSSSGYSIGLVNIIKKKPYDKLSLSWHNTPGFNVAFKSGSKKLYNIVLISKGLEKNRKLWSVGYGLGREFTLDSRVSVTMELTEQSFLTGYKHDVPILVHLQPALQFTLTRKLSLFAGPVFSLYFPGSSIPTGGTSDLLLPQHYFTIGHSAKGWFGIHAGVNLF